MNVHFLNASEKKEILKRLEAQYGIAELPYFLFETGKEKIRAFSGNLTKEEILKLAEMANIEIIGMYLIRKEHDLRLSFDATQLLSAAINKGIVEINEEQLHLWLRGNDLPIMHDVGTVALRCKEDFVGCGKSTGEKIINHVPKERRIRK